MTDFDDDPELMMSQEEPEAWSVTVDKKVKITMLHSVSVPMIPVVCMRQKCQLRLWKMCHQCELSA